MGDELPFGLQSRHGTQRVIRVKSKARTDKRVSEKNKKLRQAALHAMKEEIALREKRYVEEVFFLEWGRNGTVKRTLGVCELE